MAEGADRTDAERELLDATERAIAEHGVSALTTQKIADAWGRAQSLVHYYYDTKTDLVVGYIESLRDSLRREYAARADDPPLDRIRYAVLSDLGARECGNAATTALFELHAQAPHEDAYRTALDALESDAREFVEAAVRDGVAEGTFRDVDPATAATFLLSAHDGGVTRTLSLGRRDDAAHLRAGVEQYVRQVLLTDAAGAEWDGFAGGD